MVKNGENANLRRAPWVQFPDAQKTREKRELKTTREGHRIPHSDMRWLVTDVRGRRDNSNNGKDLWTLKRTGLGRRGVWQEIVHRRDCS